MRLQVRVTMRSHHVKVSQSYESGSGGPYTASIAAEQCSGSGPVRVGLATPIHGVLWAEADAQAAK